MKIVHILSICTCLLFFVQSATALNPDRDIHQLAHRSWSERDGYPGRTEALAQTTDGFLWLGTDNGLFRFDGVRFERYVSTSGDKLPDGPVRGLLALADGSLWVAYRLENKICVLRSGNVKSYGRADGVTSNPTTIIQDHEGILWANIETGVIRFNGARWEQIGRDWNFPENVPHITSDTLFVDHRGTLWVGVNNTVLYLDQGSKRFHPTGAFAGWIASIAEAPDGAIWLADNLSYIRAISKDVVAKDALIARCEIEESKGTPHECPTPGSPVIQVSAPDRLLFDRRGSLWITSDSSGVVRIPHPELLSNETPSGARRFLQSFSSKQGLSADNCTPELEDREGNIWVATRDGLDQFRDTALVPVSLPTSLIRVAVAPAENGDAWVVGSWSYIGRSHGDSSDVTLKPADAFKPYRDPTGNLWFLGTYSLGKMMNGRLLSVAKAPDGPATDLGSWQIASDRGGTLWAFAKGQGFLSLDHGRWKPWATPPEVTKQHATNMYSDSTGRIWVSTHEGDLVVMDRGTVLSYPANSSRPLHNIKAFAEHGPQQIWAGGEGGLMMIDRGQFRLVKPALIESFKDVMGVVDAGANGLWLNSALGVIHVSQSEVVHVLRDPSYRFQWEKFDSFDGLPGQAETIYPFPKAIQGTDGRLWFTASKGVAWIDPKVIPRNALPPPVSITSMSAGGSQYLRLADLLLPAHVGNVQIDYSALSLSVPERVRFRYKLDGVENGWQDVNTRRQAYYSNLGPGSYNFHVIACNNDGVWNETGATLGFSIAPAYYQTTWFRLCCVSALLLLICAAYLLRIRHLEAQFATNLEVRVDERTRIARDLHDTLLQRFNALLLRLQTVSNVLPIKPDEAKRRIDLAIEEASVAITEGRDTVNELRSTGSAVVDLDQAISSFAQEILSGSGHELAAPEIQVQVEGTPLPLNPVVRDEVYRIVTEAIRNAIRHANARRIDIEIRYDEHRFRVRIGDNGTGIDSAIHDREHKAGHWGLRGMRERAKLVGGTLEVWSQVGVGTEIDLSVPAESVYAKPQLARWSRFSPFRRR